MIGGADKRPPDAIPEAQNSDASPQAPRTLIIDPLGEMDPRRGLHSLSATPVGYPEEDPLSPLYARETIDETAGTIHAFWFGLSVERPEEIEARGKFWFNGGFDIDRAIAHRFTDIVAKLSAGGEAWRWAEHDPRDRVSAVIALDQFTRNIFRGTAAAFENDPLARALTLDAIATGDDKKLEAVERWFLLMPLEHSESAGHQKLVLEKFVELLADAPAEARPAFEGALDYARKHAAVIAKFGRFPHRNAALGRTSTAAELAFLKQPGSRF